MNNKPNVLVVCGRNKIRSKTAEYLYKNDNRINIRSVGLSEGSERKINEKDLQWASLILVMENKHKVRTMDMYKGLEIPKIIVLGIKDEYKYLDQELCEILKLKIEDAIKLIY
jgi:predicted protein tyrosine phosphatase